MKRVLIACEESQTVCKEFRARGYEAYSCDIQDCSGGRPEWHIKGDVREYLREKWDLIIAHPPCTFLCVTGNRWYNVERYGDAARKRYEDRYKAIVFFMRIASATCDHIAIENPIGIMSTAWRKPDQIIQPYQFGDPFEKKTALWLKGLPSLEYTKIVEPEPRVVFRSGKSGPAWYYKVDTSNASERSKIRSKTFFGIAAAMADQWGKCLL